MIARPDPIALAEAQDTLPFENYRQQYLSPERLSA